MIIGVTGLIGSGKDTVADYLCTFHGFKRVSFASSLKDAVSSVFGWDREMLEGSTKTSREWREQKDVWWSERLGMDITPRWILQYWGTDVLRNHFHTDIWVASVENKLRQSKDNIVITDCRFANEFEFLRNKGASFFRIERGDKPAWWYDYVEKGVRPESVHITEWGWINEPYDNLIKNNGTIIELKSKLRIFTEKI
jgi:hypothetical protein